MTRKDYILIADAIRETLATDPEFGLVWPDRERAAVGLVAHRIAHQLRRDNPRFDMDRFIDACGLTA
jgi:hypothetical protein